MRFLKKLSQSLIMKKGEEIAEKKTGVEKIERELPRISTAEQKKHVGKHVAIVGGKIIASAGTAESTHDGEAKAFG
ncbi:unnamed protein product [marine sediment metagenome]|uniref:DUF5678 domain-containing protein n=1 Tax=marine sediment metagenome TaxID=412755 RepID=X1NNG7_9ZZZZ